MGFIKEMESLCVLGVVLKGVASEGGGADTHPRHPCSCSLITSQREQMLGRQSRSELVLQSRSKVITMKFKRMAVWKDAEGLSLGNDKMLRGIRVACSLVASFLGWRRTGCKIQPSVSSHTDSHANLRRFR